MNKITKTILTLALITSAEIFASENIATHLSIGDESVECHYSFGPMGTALHSVLETNPADIDETARKLKDTIWIRVDIKETNKIPGSIESVSPLVELISEIQGSQNMSQLEVIIKDKKIRELEKNALLDLFRSYSKLQVIEVNDGDGGIIFLHRTDYPEVN